MAGSSSGQLGPLTARADKVLAKPRPIPGVLAVNGKPTPFHVFLPGAGSEPSLITDLDGFVGVTEVMGKGTDQDGNTLLWDADVRFMKGLYRGVDNEVHRGTFGFV
jgi:hypothetical protein